MPQNSLTLNCKLSILSDKTQQMHPYFFLIAYVGIDFIFNVYYRQQQPIWYRMNKKGCRLTKYSEILDLWCIFYKSVIWMQIWERNNAMTKMDYCVLNWIAITKQLFQARILTTNLIIRNQINPLKISCRDKIQQLKTMFSI